jgi:hypothetical protein
MKFKNYCVLLMGRTEGSALEIEKISDSKPNILNAKGIVIATFTSFVSVQEISAWFKMNKRSFFVFELNDETSDCFIDKVAIQEGLFGFLKNVDKDKLEEKTSEFLGAVGVEVPTVENELTESDIMALTQEEKDDLLNKFIDNGCENLTEEDKKIINLLSK